MAICLWRRLPPNRVAFGKTWRFKKDFYLDFKELVASNEATYMPKVTQDEGKTFVGQRLTHPLWSSWLSTPWNFNQTNVERLCTWFYNNQLQQGCWVWAAVLDMWVGLGRWVSRGLGALARTDTRAISWVRRLWNASKEGAGLSFIVEIPLYLCTLQIN